MVNREFSVHSGHWNSSDGTLGMSLRIEDKSSGVLIADLRLTPEQAYNLMRGSRFDTEGEQSPHLDRVSKLMVAESLEVPGSIISSASYGERLKVARQWAREIAPDWDVYEPRRRNNGGISVTIRKWVD
jgi:hypothetical protein